VAKDIFLL